MIRNNPFTSNIFKDTWCFLFNEGQLIHTFNFIGGLSFYKFSFLPIYINVGKNLTKGISYEFNQSAEIDDLKGKILLIYDVPEYFNIENTPLQKGIKHITARQYPGFLTNLKNFKSFEDYFNVSFSKKSRYKFKSYQRNLENNFKISYKHFYGDISKEDYDKVFEHFKKLLEKRFNDKLESNNNLDPDEWNFYYESTYKLILEKKASLYVIFDKDYPIAMSLNYFSDDILFFAITGFDINYHKYNLGKVHLMKLYQWSFENNIKVFDLSKGYYDYKERWANQSYFFKNHIYYDSTSIKSTIIAKSLKWAFTLKQFLRDKKINVLLHKITYLVKSKNPSNASANV